MMDSNSVADWSDEEIRIHYTMGHCHVMALALSRSTDLPLGVMRNWYGWHIEPDDEGLGGVKEIVHIYVDCGDGNIIDVSGIRPLEVMRREFAADEWHLCPCDPLSIAEIDEMVEQTRNLIPYDEDEILEALDVISRNRELTAAVEMFAGKAPTM